MLRAYPFFCLVQPKNFLLTTFALIAVSTAVAASDFKDRKQQGNWLVGAKALLLDPDVSSTVSIGGEARANSDVVPMVDVRYFITHDISLETMWGYSEHKLRAVGTALGDMSLGTTKILPFSLTAQYNPRANYQISPYVGVGLNYTLFVDGFPGDAQDVKYDDGFGTVFNLGVDYFLDDHRFFNIDVKKILISTDVRVDAGIAGISHAAVDLDPLLVSFGFGWVF
jgi:outer membrane protein